MNDNYPPELRILVAAKSAQAAAESAKRRAQVLAHPDIAKRLTERILRYQRPDQWSGYIPPERINRGTGWEPNRSAERAELLAIWQAAVAAGEPAQRPVDDVPLPPEPDEEPGW